MAIVMGVDEAGYGPNLGPLVIGLSAWNVDEAKDLRTDVDLYDRLAEVVARRPEGERIAIADSKTLYKPGGGLANLERGLLATLAAIRGDAPGSWNALVDRLGADPLGRRLALPWYAGGWDLEVPVEGSGEAIARGAGLLKQSPPGVRPIAMRARLVFPAEFNELCEKHGSKGLALSHVTLELLRDCFDTLPQLPASTLVTCDKHGGRNRYARLLAEHFPEHPITTVVEGRAESRYRLGPDRSVEVCFRTKGEERLETALASMGAKYLRELAMRALNQFWQTEVPGLQRTAGYPVDAKRFKKEIAKRQQQLGVDDHWLWRRR